MTLQHKKFLIARLNRLALVIDCVQKENERQMLDLKQLTQDVANTVSVAASAVKLLDLLREELNAALTAPDPTAAIAQMSADLEAGTAALSNAVTVDSQDPAAVAAVVATAPTSPAPVPVAPVVVSVPVVVSKPIVPEPAPVVVASPGPVIQPAVEVPGANIATE